MNLKNTLKNYLLYLESDPNNFNLLISISECYGKMRDFTAAEHYLEKAKKIDGTNFELAILMAKLLIKQSRPDEAIKLLEKTHKQHDPSDESLAILAEAFFDCEEIELAENTAEKALGIAPNNSEAQIILLLLRMAKSKVETSEVNSLLAKKPEDARLWFALGAAYFLDMKLEDAEKAHLKAAELEPFFCDNWISLGWCQLFLNKIKEAEIAYQQAISIFEESPEGIGGLALVAALENEFAKAEALIAKAKELEPKCFLASIAQIICANPSNSREAGKQFNQTFPTIAGQINAAIAIILQEMPNKTTTLH